MRKCACRCTGGGWLKRIFVRLGCIETGLRMFYRVFHKEVTGFEFTTSKKTIAFTDEKHF